MTESDAPSGPTLGRRNLIKGIALGAAAYWLAGGIRGVAGATETTWRGSAAGGSEAGGSALPASALGPAIGSPAAPDGDSASALRPDIHPRSDWAGRSLVPLGPLPGEPDVRFLVVHHSEDPANDYSEPHVPAMIRKMYYKHVGPDRNWPDIAYNFCVDQFGGIWEARAGSLAGPVAGDARYGSQGHDQKVCWVGDLRRQPPTAAAVASMVQILAWMACRYGVDPSPEATVRFVSRGSSRYPAGATVSAWTIDGHRSMSSHTDCPGNYGWNVVRGVLPYQVSALLGLPAF